MEKFHIFYLYGGAAGKLRYAYDVTMRAIIFAIKKDKPRPKHECPALVLNKFYPDSKDVVRNRYELLHHTTGWFALDVDNVQHINLLKKELFKCCPSLRIVWQSASKKGIKAIGYSPLLVNLDPQPYRHTYAMICESIKKEVGMRINFDQTAGRCHQPIFLNSDKRALVR